MMENTVHIVKTLIVENNGTALSMDASLRSNIAGYFKHSFPELLDEVLSEVFPYDKIVSIGRLSITLEWDNAKVNGSLKQHLREQLFRQLKEFSSTQKETWKKQAAGNEVIEDLEDGANASFLKAFIFFLENGYYPWWAKSRGQHAVILLRQASSAKALLQPVLKDERVIKRLAFSSDGLLFTLIGLLMEKNIQEVIDQMKKSREFFIKNAFIAIENLQQVPNEKLLSACFKFFLIKHYNDTGTIAGPALKEKLQSALNVLNQKKGVTDPQLWKHLELSNLNSENQEVDDSDIEAIWIHNAGMVILNPFLPALFKRLGVADENDLISDPGKTMLLLYYMVYGTQDYDEALMPLAKILCGQQVNATVAVLSSLSTEDLQECDELLCSVIAHWAALKNTSPAGLRDGFFYRDAKLNRQGEGWELTVETKGHDVLLDHIPWSVNYIKLPWMKSLLHVIWRN